MLKGIDVSTFREVGTRVTHLLKRANDDSIVQFEISVLNKLVFLFIEGASERLSELSAKGDATFESKFADSMRGMTDLMTSFGCFGGETDLAAANEACRFTMRSLNEACRLSDSPTWRASLSQTSVFFSGSMVLSYREDWNPGEFDSSEAGIMETINFYQYHVCGKIFKNSGNRVDWYRIGGFLPTLVLWYGNLEGVKMWHQKAIAAWREVDLRTSRKYTDEIHDVHIFAQSGLALLVMLDENAKAADLLHSIGFTWDKEGFENFELWFTGLNTQVPSIPHDAWHDVNKALIRIYTFLSFPNGIIDESEVNEWIPSPQELAQMEREFRMIQTMHIYDVVSSGAKAFLKLGRHDDAYALSKIAVSPEQKTLKKTTLVPCHSILGQVAAKRGDLEEAEGHFANALNEAKLSRLPMLELIAARDWKRHLLEPHGRDTSAVESTIDGACVRMEKTREQLGSVLASGGGA